MIKINIFKNTFGKTLNIILNLFLALLHKATATLHEERFKQAQNKIKIHLEHMKSVITCIHIFINFLYYAHRNAWAGPASRPLFRKQT